MYLKTIKSICLSYLALLFIFYLSKIDALSHKWISVPKSQHGEQLWNQNSIQENPDGLIRVVSKFVPKSATDISQDILYKIDVNCSEKVFRDIAFGANKFNEYENKDSEWKDPNENKLILGVIDQVCVLIN